MPIYEFMCSACGPFETYRAMREANEPTSCPTCRRTAPRILSLPVLMSTSRNAQRQRERLATPHVVQRRMPEPPLPAIAAYPQRNGRPWQLHH